MMFRGQELSRTSLRQWGALQERQPNTSRKLNQPSSPPSSNSLFLSRYRALQDFQLPNTLLVVLCMCECRALSRVK
jgi:hypothetical protein